MNMIILGIFCFICGGLFGIFISCAMQISHASDNYQYSDEGLDSNEKESGEITKK